MEDASSDEYEQPERDSPLRQASARELTEALAEALDELPPQMRDCARLRLREGLTYREIAASLQITIDVVKVQLNRARKRLRYRLGDHFEQAASQNR